MSKDSEFLTGLFAISAALIMFYGGGLLTWTLCDWLGIYPLRVDSWNQFLQGLVWVVFHPGYELTSNSYARLAIPTGLAAAAALIVAFATYVSMEALEDGRHLRGRKYLTGRKASKQFARYMRAASTKKEEGLPIHPALAPVPARVELEHFFLLAGTGAGKTSVLMPWVLASIHRGDRVIVFDVKGDYTSAVPVRPTVPVLVAPWDRRSDVWAISDDVSTLAAAREFSAGIIGESRDNPMWSNSARAILTGLIVSLIHCKPGRWGFADLAELIAAPRDTIAATLRIHHPEALQFVVGKNVTVAGILINLNAFCSPLSDLARAWPAPPAPGKGFSIRRWLLDSSPANRVVVIQGNAQFKQLQVAISQALIGLASRIVASPLLPEMDNRLRIFIDEFPSWGRVDGVETILSLGRSKGIGCVLAGQSVDQLKSIYPAERVSGWLSMVGTIVVGRTTGDTAHFVCEKLVGKRIVERGQRSSGTRRGAGNDTTVTRVPVTELVVMPSELSELGPNKTGVSMIWLAGRHALKLHFPFANVPRIREPMIYADWAKEGEPSNPPPQARASAEEPTTVAPQETVDPSFEKHAPDVRETNPAALQTEISGHTPPAQEPSASRASDALSSAQPADGDGPQPGGTRRKRILKKKSAKC